MPAPPYDDFHARATVAQLFVYPVKSCGGIALQQSPLAASGLAFDRAWMVVDEQGFFVTQRSLPRMALVRPELRAHDLVLRAPGMPELAVPLALAGPQLQVRVWRDTLLAREQGDLAAQWFSDFLGQRLWLVRCDPAHPRLSSKDWTGGRDAPNLFSDGYALLVVSQASLDGLNERLLRQGRAPVGMERFRPNLVLAEVEAHDEDRFEMLHIGGGDGDGAGEEIQLQPVKPCVRCPIPNIDPATALSDPAVGDALQGYRSDPRMGGGVTFGTNAIVRAGAGQVLRVGQPVYANYRFD
ncbi:MAG: MOSC N-terminal beta barrel domain-containing protein [Pseudomonadota bacterium]